MTSKARKDTLCCVRIVSTYCFRQAMAPVRGPSARHGLPFRLPRVPEISSHQISRSESPVAIFRLPAEQPRGVAVCVRCFLANGVRSPERSDYHVARELPGARISQFLESLYFFFRVYSYNMVKRRQFAVSERNYDLKAGCSVHETSAYCWVSWLSSKQRKK